MKYHLSPLPFSEGNLSTLWVPCCVGDHSRACRFFFPINLEGYSIKNCIAQLQSHQFYLFYQCYWKWAYHFVLCLLFDLANNLTASHAFLSCSFEPFELNAKTHLAYWFYFEILSKACHCYWESINIYRGREAILFYSIAPTILTSSAEEWINPSSCFIFLN